MNIILRSPAFCLLPSTIQYYIHIMSAAFIVIWTVHTHTAHIHWRRYIYVLFYLPLSYRTNEQQDFIISVHAFLIQERGVGVHLFENRTHRFWFKCSAMLFTNIFNFAKFSLATDLNIFLMFRIQCEQCWSQLLFCGFSPCHQNRCMMAFSIGYRKKQNNSPQINWNWQSEKTKKDNCRGLQRPHIPNE